MRFAASTVLVFLLGSCAAPPPKVVAPTPEASDEPLTREQTLAGASLILDVRTPEEYAAGHLEKAMLMPIAVLETRIVEVDDAVDDDKTKKVVVYCKSGKRAGHAKNVLEAHGYTHVVNGGGYEDLR